MSKKIVVDSCEHCPLLELESFCTHAHIDGWFIKDIHIIDPNCPLEDNKPSCKCHT